MSDCIFCKIASGEIKTNTVYEDGDVIAFLDLHPINAGHTLVIPKIHVPEFVDFDDQTSAKVWAVVQKLSKNIKQKLSPKKVGIMVEGWDVSHAHVHIVPLNDERDIGSRRTEEDHEAPSAEELARIVDIVRMDA